MRDDVVVAPATLSQAWPEQQQRRRYKRNETGSTLINLVHSAIPGPPRAMSVKPNGGSEYQKSIPIFLLICPVDRERNCALKATHTQLTPPRGAGSSEISYGRRSDTVKYGRIGLMQ